MSVETRENYISDKQTAYPASHLPEPITVRQIIFTVNVRNKMTTEASVEML